jgi:hypothetical protein
MYTVGKIVYPIPTSTFYRDKNFVGKSVADKVVTMLSKYLVNIPV